MRFWHLVSELNPYSATMGDLADRLNDRTYRLIVGELLGKQCEYYRIFRACEKNVRALSTHPKWKLAGLTAALYVEATKTKTLGIALTF